MARRKIISDENVLAAAAKVMFSVGPSFTLADVAKAAGLSPATLAQRFGDKHGLTVAAIARDNVAFKAFLAGAPDEIGADSVIGIFAAMFDGPDTDADHFADQLLWLRQDMRDPDLNRLARERFAALRAAVAARMPTLGIAPETAARLVQAQWEGALLQWGIERHGRLSDFVTAQLRAWFGLLKSSPAGGWGPRSGGGGAPPR
jgi:AcrR family transcriptional regulator